MRDALDECSSHVSNSDMIDVDEKSDEDEQSSDFRKEALPIVQTNQISKLGAELSVSDLPSH